MKDKLLKLLKYNYGNSDEIEELEETHISNFLGDLNATIELWYIKFSYITTRNNQKEKIIYLTPSAGYENVEEVFNNYIEDFNNKNIHRKLSNVKILDSGVYDTYKISL